MASKPGGLYPMFRITVIVDGFQLPDFYVEAVSEQAAQDMGRNITDPMHAKSIRIRVLPV